MSKLVRDKIPEIIKKDGRTPTIHIASIEEYQEALNKKLFEEVGEFLETPSVEEVADIMEVIMAICEQNNVDLSDLEGVRKNKADKRGGFKQRIILES